MRALVIVLVLGACGGGPPPVTPLDAERAHVALAELQAGRTLLVAKCGGCHTTPLPTDHAVAEWPGKLGEMSVRAGLDAPQRTLIERYLVTMDR